MISATIINVCRSRDEIKQIENYEMAVNDKENMWECHHRLEIQDDGTELSSSQLKQIGLYWKQPANLLIFLLRKDHRKLHSKTNLAKQARETTHLKSTGIERTSWIKFFKDMTKKEILKWIDNSDLNAQVKSALRQRFVYSTPKGYTRKPKAKKVRINKDWKKILEGKTREEMLKIIDEECQDMGQRSRLRKKFGIELTREEIVERQQTQSPKWQEYLEKNKQQWELKKEQKKKERLMAQLKKEHIKKERMIEKLKSRIQTWENHTPHTPARERKLTELKSSLQYLMEID